MKKKHHDSIDLDHEIYTYARWNSPDRLENLFDDNTNIKLTYDTYDEPLGMAISHGYIKVLEILLNHYHKYKLNGNPESVEYKFAKHQLLDIIEKSLPYTDDPKVLEMINPYCSTEDDESDRASDLDREFGIELIEEENNNNSKASSKSSSFGESMLTFENLKAHTDSFLLGDRSGTSELTAELE